jgi:4-alpha-methyl-delta7-sterol-4alpha-methyl oxidase
MQEFFSSWAAIYQEPLFWSLPIAANLVSMGAFLLFAAPLTWIANSDAAWARRYKIQSRHERQVTVAESLRQWLLNNAWMLAVGILAWPLLRQTTIHLGPLPAWYLIIAQVILFIYIDDFLYYWMHRAMHTRWLLKHVHGLHHRIYAPRAIAGHYMHPLEYVLTGLLALAGPSLFGAHVVTVWIWIAFRQWEAVEGHCGYDFPWSPTRWLPLSDGALHHDFHHARVRGNYAGFLSWTDRVFGTFVPEYAAERSRIRGAQTNVASG